MTEYIKVKRAGLNLAGIIEKPELKDGEKMSTSYYYAWFYIGLSVSSSC